jgi:hypothetical protein
LKIRAHQFEKPASLGFRRHRISLAELIDATAGIHNFLLAGIERMAVGTNFDLQILANGRASLELIAAGTSDRDDFIIWMDAGFHGNLDMSVAAESTSLFARRHAWSPRSGRRTSASKPGRVC